MSKADVQANRLWNFRQLIKLCGGTNEAARIMGRYNSQITQVAGENPTRNIGDKIAANIETAFALEPGSLDLPPPKEALEKERGTRNRSDPAIAKIGAVLANATDDDKDFVLAFAQLMVNRSIRKNSTYDSSKIMVDARNIGKEGSAE